MVNWKGATAIVTGGGSGIGKALSLAMAKRGAHVLVTDINAEAAAQVAAACGADASAQTLDVRDAAAVQACVDGFVSTHGKLDYFFNNAGMGVAGEVYEIALEAWDRVIDINIRGVVHGVAAAYPIMVKQKSGHIINTASLAGLGPAPLLTPYAMTKHAVVGLSTSLRIEGKAHNVKVSVLCPSAIETPLLDAQNPPTSRLSPGIPTSAVTSPDLLDLPTPSNNSQKNPWPPSSATRPWSCCPKKRASYGVWAARCPM